jgi:hypothetical protein
VGLSVWEDVYDWHVRVQQPLSVSRLTDGRYALAFMFTQLVLRHEMAANYVGPGYDKSGRSRRPGLHEGRRSFTKTAEWAREAGFRSPDINALGLPRPVWAFTKPFVASAFRRKRWRKPLDLS